MSKKQDKICYKDRCEAYKRILEHCVNSHKECHKWTKDKEIEKWRDKNPLDFDRYIAVLYKKKKLTYKELIDCVEHYYNDFDGENCHAECFCEATDRDFSKIGYCPNSEH